jgi:hypothetical protein
MGMAGLPPGRELRSYALRMSGSYRLDRFQTGDVLAAGKGFEPLLPDSESGVLPLDDPAKRPRSLSRGRTTCERTTTLRLK